MDENRDNCSKDIKTARRYQTEVTEVRSTIATLKNTLVRFNS